MRGVKMNTEYNNLKQIREIYGATQEEISKAININRATISNWETGTSKASSASLEKLSLFYGIGPEFFYDKEVDNVVKEMLALNSKKAIEIEIQSNGKHKKVDEFNELFSDITFNTAIKKYMFAMKMLLANADNGELKDLKIACEINKKMGSRLEAFVKLREQEEKAKREKDENTLYDLMDSLSKDHE